MFVLLQVVTFKTTQNVWQESVIVGLAVPFPFVMPIGRRARHLDVS